MKIRMYSGVTIKKFLVNTLLLVVCFTTKFAFSEIADLKPVWLTVACYKVTLNAFDKLDGISSHHIRYDVKADDGSEFSAERDSERFKSEESQVVFPDDFFNNKLHLPASVDCNYGKN